MSTDTIRIGTRGSALALWQAHYVAGLLGLGGLATEIVTIETKGDRILDRSLAKIGSKGIFTAELEDALHGGHVDIAVHSAKDLQSSLPPGLQLIAFTEREIASDVLVSLNPGISLTGGQPWRIGTSSTRRVAMLRHFYPHLVPTDMRGNLQTRMRKLHENHCDALILAYAGVHRMNYDAHIAAHLPTETFTPAVGQGSVAIESSVRLAEDKSKKIRALVNHVPTETCLRAERAFLRELEGGCSIPVFGLAGLDVLKAESPVFSGDTISLHAGIISLDGTQLIHRTLHGNPSEPETLGIRMAGEILAAGGAQILRDIRCALPDS